MSRAQARQGKSKGKIDHFVCVCVCVFLRGNFDLIENSALSFVFIVFLLCVFLFLFFTFFLLESFEKEEKTKKKNKY